MTYISDKTVVHLEHNLPWESVSSPWVHWKGRKLPQLQPCARQNPITYFADAVHGLDDYITDTGSLPRNNLFLSLTMYSLVTLCGEGCSR